MELTINGIDIVEFSLNRIPKENRKESVHYFDVRYGENGDLLNPVTVEQDVQVNYCCTIGLKNKLKLGNTPKDDFYELTEEERDALIFELTK